MSDVISPKPCECPTGLSIIDLGYVDIAASSSWTPPSGTKILCFIVESDSTYVSVRGTNASGTTVSMAAGGKVCVPWDSTLSLYNSGSSSLRVWYVAMG